MSEENNFKHFNHSSSKNLYGIEHGGYETPNRKMSSSSAHADLEKVRKLSYLHRFGDYDHNGITMNVMPEGTNLKPISRSSSRNFLGMENGGYETPSRKISSTSHHADMGKVRKLSYLHRFGELEHNNVTMNGDRKKKLSATSTRSYKSAHIEPETPPERTWWYEFCLKCHSEDDEKPSWEPKFWENTFPKPYFPTYRTFSRIISIALIGILSYCILYGVVGDDAAPPNGKVFQLLVLSISAYLGGWLISLTTMPALVGMLFTGILFQNVNFVNIDSSFSEITKIISDVALVIILIRAGLDLDPVALGKLKFVVLKLALIPWITEAAVVTVLSKFCLGITWSYSLMLGTIVAAVAPAVVVPCLLRLREKGFGVAKGIPTLIIAVASIDDSMSVAIFGIIKTVLFSDSSTTMIAILGPLSLVIGVVFGFIWGVLCNFIPERHDPFKVPLRILLLLAGGLGTVFGSDILGYSGAGPLACVTAGFVAIYCWTKQGWDIEDNPAATAFEIFWLIIQPVLFGVTGARIKLDELNGETVLISLGIIFAGIIAKCAITMVAGIGCKLNLKEKFFIAIPWMGKAIVQAALGPVVLSLVKTDTKEYDYGKKILNTAILSIIIAAPAGAFLTTVLGPYLLTKQEVISPSLPASPQTRKRKKSRKTSIRDIEFVFEEENARQHVNGTATPPSMAIVIEENENGKI